MRIARTVVPGHDSASDGSPELVLLLSVVAFATDGAALVFQTDFGLKDGAVSAMKGVAHGVDPRLPQFDLTHEIPGVQHPGSRVPVEADHLLLAGRDRFRERGRSRGGTERRAVVAKTRDGRHIVTPDNGALTFLAVPPDLPRSV